MIRRLAGGVIGSRLRLNITALPVAVVAAASLEEVSLTRWPAGCKETRMMSTTADAVNYDDMTPAELLKLYMSMPMPPKGTPKDIPKFIPRVPVKLEDIITDSWESLEKKIVDVPAVRTEEEMSAIFERWSAHYNKTYATASEKKKRFEVFKEKFWHIDNPIPCFFKHNRHLDPYFDLTTCEYLMCAKNEKIQ